MLIHVSRNIRYANTWNSWRNTISRRICLDLPFEGWAHYKYLLLRVLHYETAALHSEIMFFLFFFLYQFNTKFHIFPSPPQPPLSPSYPLSLSLSSDSILSVPTTVMKVEIIQNAVSLWPPPPLSGALPLHSVGGLGDPQFPSLNDGQIPSVKARSAPGHDITKWYHKKSYKNNL